MSVSVIQVEQLGKRYRLGAGGAGGLASIRRFLGARVAGADQLWALRGVDFDIQAGQVVGILGRNGAGKSTLLKILSRITEPTEGCATLRGRVASLLEVGTGFHPELTGRENVYLNGAILGMSGREVKSKFDAIVDFSGVERFLQTPVKRYSSGMKMRLAFAVAAHLEPEILVVDEVLAVGDAAFQKKCMGKMKDVAGQGRTVLLVSHNLAAISSLCDRGLVLEGGRLAFDGGAREAVRYYTAGDIEGLERTRWAGQAGDEDVKLLATWVRPTEEGGALDTGGELEIGLEFQTGRPIEGLICGLTLHSEFEGELAYVLYDDAQPAPAQRVEPGRHIKRFILPANTLAAGRYRIEFDLGIHMVRRIIRKEGSLLAAMENISGVGRRFVLPPGPGRTSLFRPAWRVIEEFHASDGRLAA